MSEKRAFERKALEHTVRVLRYDGSETTCVMADISRSGARLKLDQPELIPNEFMLVIREDLRRRCNVVVRTGNSVGIVFVGRPEATVDRLVDHGVTEETTPTKETQ